LFTALQRHDPFTSRRQNFTSIIASRIALRSTKQVKRKPQRELALLPAYHASASANLLRNI
jgi:hypothetical protein